MKGLSRSSDHLRPFRFVHLNMWVKLSTMNLSCHVTRPIIIRWDSMRSATFSPNEMHVSVPQPTRSPLLGTKTNIEFELRSPKPSCKASYQFNKNVLWTLMPVSNE